MLRDLRPRIALFENVPGLFVSNGGRFFNGILSDISEVGYACEWQIISASDVGAPHLRKRVWIVCYTFGGGQRGVSRRRSGSEFADGHLQLEKQPVADAEIGEQQKFSQRDNRQKHGRKTQIGHGLGTGGGGLGRDTAEGTGNAGGAAAEVSKAVSYHADSARQQGGIIRQGQMPVRGSYTRNVSDAESERLQGVGKTGKQIAVTQREEEKPERLRHRSDWWATEPDVGRVAHGIPSRMDRLKCLGNSVVPQCPEMIFNLPVFNRFRNNFV
jgi:DNA (cytosine-5)-methyltransferase 1